MKYTPSKSIESQTTQTVAELGHGIPTYIYSSRAMLGQPGVLIPVASSI